MSVDGPAFYDDPAVFARYRAQRGWGGNPNDTMEGPAFWQLVGNLENRTILDLGCGAGETGRVAWEMGCSRYVGVDGSANMVQAARTALAGTPCEIRCARIEDWRCPDATFDLVVSRLAFHYVRDLRSCLNRACRALRPGGRLIFTVEHPVLTSCDQSAREPGPRTRWIVDRYFETGERSVAWMGGTVVKYHRTVADHVRTVQEVGLCLEALEEPAPRPELLDPDEFRRRLRVPLFLAIAARKPKAP